MAIQQDDDRCDSNVVILRQYSKAQYIEKIGVDQQ